MAGLCDFLYSDHERVASFLAQLNGIGVLKSNEQTSSKSKNEGSKGSAKLPFADFGISSDRDWSKEIRHQFDPLWINSKTLIEHVSDQQGFCSDDLSLGKLTILSGTLLAYDLSSLTAMLQADAMTEFIAAGATDNTGFENRSKKAAEQIKKNQAEIVRHFLKGLPLGIGFILITEIGHFWFGVKKEYLSLYDLDIPLKFPAHVSGTWNVLGVIDALPHDHVDALTPIIEKSIDGLIPGMVAHMLQLIGVTVGLFGRPITAHGLSPLVIYRELHS
ncbi:MAG TPA: hypothetical protein VJQ77_09850 [Novosphingobium sp.]|nr:hypothetical protein [Novosphingobium sp.]